MSVMCIVGTWQQLSPQGEILDIFSLVGCLVKSRHLEPSLDDVGIHALIDGLYHVPSRKK